MKRSRARCAGSGAHLPVASPTFPVGVEYSIAKDPGPARGPPYRGVVGKSWKEEMSVGKGLGAAGILCGFWEGKMKQDGRGKRARPVLRDVSAVVAGAALSAGKGAVRTRREEHNHHRNSISASVPLLAADRDRGGPRSCGTTAHPVHRSQGRASPG